MCGLLSGLLFFVSCAIEEFAVFRIPVTLVAVGFGVFTTLTLGAKAI